MAVFFFYMPNYHEGYMPVASSSTYNLNLDSLIEKKQELNKVTGTIINSVKKRKKSFEPISASDINILCHNLHLQFLTDNQLHSILHRASNESTKQQAKKILIHSAAWYHKELQQNLRLRKIINRGNSGARFKSHILLHSQYFLWNHKNLRQAREMGINLHRKDKFHFLAQNFADRIYELLYIGSNFTNKICGYTWSNIKIGVLFSRHNKFINSQLQKWDIVCIKSPYNVTDKIIPGHFGHVVIYMGNNTFAEAVKDGVNFNRNIQITDQNSVIVLRPVNLTEEQKKHMQTVLESQFGKEYDFNYNTESPDRIFCSELIYLVYDNINWKTRDIHFHHSLSPDHLIQTAMEGTDFYIPLYFERERQIKNPTKRLIGSMLH